MPKSWPNVYKQGSGWIVDCGTIDGKRKRIFRASKTAAMTEASIWRERRQLQNIGVRDLTPTERMDAVQALKILSGTGATLSQAASDFKRRIVSEITIGDLWTEYFDRKQKSGIRAKSIQSLESREGRFASSFDWMAASEISPEFIEKWLDEMRFKPVTRNGYLRGLKTLFGFALKKGYVLENPASNVDYVRTSPAQPVVLGVEQAEKILNWCVQKNPRMVPYYAIGLFAGLRPDEIKRIPIDDINLDDRLITVSFNVTKTRMRHVKIRDNLAAWLAAWPPIGPKVYWHRYWHDKLTAALKFDEWPHDVCRKSFISYHLAAFRDLAETVQEAGHRDSKMIFTHYRNIRTLTGDQITTDYSNRYWQILPSPKKQLNPKSNPMIPKNGTPLATCARAIE